MKHVEIEKVSEDSLSSVLWIFYYNDSRHHLVLNYYIEYSRRTRRHKFRIDKKYNRLDKRNNTIDIPPLPDEIEAEALYEFSKGLKVVI